MTTQWKPDGTICQACWGSGCRYCDARKTTPTEPTGVQADDWTDMNELKRELKDAYADIEGYRRDLEAARVERDARPTMAHHMAKVTDLRAQLASAAKDAARFNHLQNMPRTLAQALFWQFESRKQRARAIDEAIAALASDAAANKEREL